VQTSAAFFGGNKSKSFASIQEAASRKGKRAVTTGYGGHFRAIQGFKYLGE
jgi:hypothetical protein